MYSLSFFSRLEKQCLNCVFFLKRSGHFWKMSRMYPTTQPNENALSAAGVSESISKSVKVCYKMLCF